VTAGYSDDEDDPEDADFEEESFDSDFESVFVSDLDDDSDVVEAPAFFP
jgi:hypothetical protein